MTFKNISPVKISTRSRKDPEKNHPLFSSCFIRKSKPMAFVSRISFPLNRVMCTRFHRGFTRGLASRFERVFAREIRRKG